MSTYLHQFGLPPFACAGWSSRQHTYRPHRPGWANETLSGGLKMPATQRTRTIPGPET